MNPDPSSQRAIEELLAYLDALPEQERIPAMAQLVASALQRVPANSIRELRTELAACHTAAPASLRDDREDGVCALELVDGLIAACDQEPIRNESP